MLPNNSFSQGNNTISSFKNLTLEDNTTKKYIEQKLLEALFQNWSLQELLDQGYPSITILKGGHQESPSNDILLYCSEDFEASQSDFLQSLSHIINSQVPQNTGVIHSIGTTLGPSPKLESGTLIIFGINRNSPSLRNYLVDQFMQVRKGLPKILQELRAQQIIKKVVLFTMHDFQPTNYQEGIPRDLGRDNEGRAIQFGGVLYINLERYFETFTGRKGISVNGLVDVLFSHIRIYEEEKTLRQLDKYKLFQIFQNKKQSIKEGNEDLYTENQLLKRQKEGLFETVGSMQNQLVRIKEENKILRERNDWILKENELVKAQMSKIEKLNEELRNRQFQEPQRNEKVPSNLTRFIIPAGNQSQINRVRMMM